MPEITDERQKRVAENQSLFREINERLRQLNETFEQLTPHGTWTCECADLRCVDPIEMTLGEYEALREHPARFAIVPHGAHFYGDVERVVQETERYWVVEKTDTANKVATQLSQPGSKRRVAETSPAIVAGVFQLSFGSEDAALAAAREARTRGFVVDVTQQSEGRWEHHARVRAPAAATDLSRYASRLRKVAVTFDGAYHSFTPD